MSSIAAPRPVVASPRPAAAPTMAAIDPIRLLKKYKWVLVISAVAGALLGLGAHVVWRLVAPQWTSSASFEVTGVKTSAGEMDTNIDEKELERFMATQAARMVFDEVLKSAASRPSFAREAKQWAAPYMERGQINAASAALALKESVRARPIVGTQYISLSMTARDKHEATAIVKHVREAYMENLRQERNSRTSVERKSLSDQIAALELEIDNMARNRDQRMKDMKVDSIDGKVSETRSALMSINETLLQRDNELKALMVSIQQMERDIAGGVYSETLRNTVELNPQIQRIRTAINDLEARRLALQEQVTPAHRDVRFVENEIAGQNRRLEQERERLLAETRESQFEAMKIQEQQLRATIDEMTRQKAEYLNRLNELTLLQAAIMDIDQRIDAKRATQANLEATLGNLETLRTTEEFYRVILAEREQVPIEMSWPKMIFMLPLGVILVTGLVGGAIFLRELLDQRVKTPSDVTMIPRAQVLAMIPHSAEDPTSPAAPETAFRDQSRGVTAESYRQLRAVLLQRLKAHGHRTILVASGMPGSGASSVVSNIGAALATADQKTLLIDANFRRPSLHRIFGLPDSPGLADVLRGAISVEAAAQATETPNLSVLTCGGESDGVEKLGTDRMARMLDEAKQHFDVIIIDVAPAVVSGDAGSLANRCDASILVTRAYAEKRGLVARLVQDFLGRRAEFLGVVINAVRASSGGYFKSNIRVTQAYNNPAA